MANQKYRTFKTKGKMTPSKKTKERRKGLSKFRRVAKMRGLR